MHRFGYIFFPFFNMYMNEAYFSCELHYITVYIYIEREEFLHESTLVHETLGMVWVSRRNELDGFSEDRPSQASLWKFWSVTVSNTINKFLLWSWGWSKTVDLVEDDDDDKEEEGEEQKGWRSVHECFNLAARTRMGLCFLNLVFCLGLSFTLNLSWYLFI